MPSTTTAPAPPPTVTVTSAQLRSPRGSRDPWFDNAKFALVALVVVGHTWVLTPSGTTHGWLYTFLYSWHVPAFVLVTGYLSRSFTYSRRRLWSLVTTVAVPYVVFSTLLFAFRDLVGGEDIGLHLLNPSWPMWYLTALFMWRLATPVFNRVPLPVAVAAAVAVSLVGGAYAGQTFDVARAAGLLPFFVIGLRLRREHLALLHRPVARFAALLALVGLFVAAPALRALSNEWLYYRSSYADLDAGLGQGMLLRLLVLAVGLVGALSVLALIPAGRTWMTRLGAASLVVYLCHGFFVKGATYLGVEAWGLDHPALSMLLLPAGAVLVAVLLAQPVVARRLQNLVDPVGWWHRRVKPTAPDPQAGPDARPVAVQQVPMSALGR